MHHFSLFPGSSKPWENILSPDRGTGKAYWDMRSNCWYSVNSHQSERVPSCRLCLMAGFSVSFFSWVMVGLRKRVYPGMRGTKYFPSLNSNSWTSVQEQALTAVGWHGERLTCGLSGKLWGFQRTPLGFEWIFWLGNTGIKHPALIITDSGGCGCIGTELRGSVIVSLGECLAFVAFWWIRVSFMRQN